MKEYLNFLTVPQVTAFESLGINRAELVRNGRGATASRVYKGLYNGVETACKLTDTAREASFCLIFLCACFWQSAQVNIQFLQENRIEIGFVMLLIEAEKEMADLDITSSSSYNSLNGLRACAALHISIFTLMCVLIPV